MFFAVLVRACVSSAAAAATADGGCVLLGPYDYYGTQFLAARFNASGGLQWAWRFSVAPHGQMAMSWLTECTVTAARATSDGGLIVIGYTCVSSLACYT